MKITLRTPQTATYKDADRVVQSLTLPENVAMNAHRDGRDHWLVEVNHPEVAGGVFLHRVHNMYIRQGEALQVGQPITGLTDPATP